ncbi:MULTISPECIES: hypothetical protein [Streptomyces]|uniref:Uncharacterized protein n=2 Tax=Streptomyces TaxID=1883 RepID=A0ABU2VUD5_9ACTN|nr:MULTISPECIES: hypothetical protein [Streptomyces]MDT0488563.1 hypothetical protein [Streptomyces sp. DSM 41640]MDT0488908.1 hypothetical protein [Streptomyces griseus]
MPTIAPPETDEPEVIESDTADPNGPGTDEDDQGTAEPLDLVGALLAA